MSAYRCPHCHGTDGIYRQTNGSLACLDCYWDEDDDEIGVDGWGLTPTQI